MKTKKENEKMKNWKNFLSDESGMGTVENAISRITTVSNT